MGVRKFHSVEEMPGPAPREPLDPENLRIAFGLMETTHRLAGVRRRPGVRKFRSWDDLLAARDREPVDGRRSQPKPEG
jgi:hypothetical protein